MRRQEITRAINDSVIRHFQGDVADQFDHDDYDNMARLFQDNHQDSSEGDIDRVIREVAADTDGRTMDRLADGEYDNPNAWLYSKIRDNI